MQNIKEFYKNTYLPFAYTLAMRYDVLAAKTIFQNFVNCETDKVKKVVMKIQGDCLGHVSL